MSARLIEFLLKRAPRERVLLGLLVLVVLPLALGLGLLWPLAEQRQAAARELAEARALDLWVLERQAEIATLAKPVVETDIPAPVGASALEQSLIARRLRASLSELETRDGGEIVLRFESVEFTDLMRWIDTQDTDWGYTIRGLRIERIERPALVEARMTLVPAAVMSQAGGN